MYQVIDLALLGKQQGKQRMPPQPVQCKDTSCQHGVPHTYRWGGGTGSFSSSTKEKQHCWHTARVCGHDGGASLYVKPEGGTHSTDKLCSSRAMSQNNWHTFISRGVQNTN